MKALHEFKRYSYSAAEALYTILSIQQSLRLIT
jgi:hypothetical protein